MSSCQGCGVALTADSWFDQYCTWACHVERARREGGKTIAPNGLPIVAIVGENTMLEHYHADHPDYKFPVTVECLDEHDYKSDYPRDEALIYSDGGLAVTLHEGKASMWHVHSRTRYGDTSESEPQVRLGVSAVHKIKAMFGRE